MSFEVNAGRRSSILCVGREASPILCIDDFAADPAALVNLAVHADFIDVGSNYPGVRAPAPQAYATAMLQSVAPAVAQVFGSLPEAELDLCAWSIVTTPPGFLRASQRIPHFDGPEVGRLAYLHYLCDPSQGGTSFYRHRATGLESVTPPHLEAYRRQVATELREAGPGGEYVAGETPRFERIHTVDALFNRLIVYKGNSLHSGDIGPRTVLSENPRAGRLTLNGFGFLRR